MANEQKRPYEPDNPNRGNTGDAGPRDTGKEPSERDRKDQGGGMNRDRKGEDSGTPDRPRDMDRDRIRDTND